MASKTISQRELTGLKETYGRLAEALGVDINEKKVEPFLNQLIRDLTNTAIEQSHEKLASLTSRVNAIAHQMKQAKEYVEDCEEEAEHFREKVNSLNRDDVLCGIEKELDSQLSKFKVECEKVASAYQERMNPFHSAIDDFLNQLDEHKFPPESRGRALAEFIRSIGFLHYQGNEQEIHRTPRVGRRV